MNTTNVPFGRPHGARPLQITLLALCALSGAAFAQPKAGQLTIAVDQPGVQVSPLLYGVFFEEINRAGEGGIYAEMIQNRSFEDAATPIAWKAVNASISLDKSLPLNANNTTSLRVEAAAGGGVANGGFARDWNQRNDPGRISVEKGTKYDLSLYARAPGPVTLTVSLEGANREILASQEIGGLGAAWKQFTITLSPSATDAYARVVITSKTAATFWLDMVSLFPQETWKGRKNGLRADLMERIAAMKPAFVRFPGGCFVEGQGTENRVQWKKTIGDVAERPGHLNANWGYYSSDGLGQHEYLQMCEDLGAEPLFVINVGIAHGAGKMEVIPMDQMGPYVQDALDAIEYANGPVTSTWGAKRAANGHPAPFNLKMMEIGNENWGPDYDQRYALFHDAIKAKYPDMQLVANEKTPSRTNDIIDPHDYNDVPSFLRNAKQFDSADRSGPKIYLGEYAMTIDAGRGHLLAGLAEAAYMTGLERNGDIIKMSSYAPLFCNPDWRGWNPNAIIFDQKWSYGTPSYWVQAMFANNRSDRIYPLSLEVPLAAAPDIKGMVGVGTWGGQAEFKDIKVVGKDGKTLLESDFSKGLGGWKTPRGQWVTDNGVLRQTSNENGAIALIGDPDWHDYTLTLKARKLSGSEGFLITFGAPNDSRKSWWNLGGWGNAGHGVEAFGLTCPRADGTIETDRWYDIKIEVQGGHANFYLDGALVHSLDSEPLESFAAVAGLDQKTGETILKFVNASDEARKIDIDLRGAKAGKISGKASVLTSAGPRDENSFEAPDRITPREEPFAADAPKFSRTFPPNSLTILRWK